VENKIIVTVCGTYQVGENEYVTDFISKEVGEESIYDLIAWGEKVLGKKISVNELKFSTLEQN